MPARSTGLFRNQDGASTTEYAVIMALIAAAVMLGADALRFAADSSFRRSALALNHPEHYRGRPSLTAGDEMLAAQTDSPTLLTAAIPPVHAFAWGVLIAATGIVGHVRYRKWRAKRAVKEIDFQAEVAPEAPSNPNFRKRQEIQRCLLRHFDEALQSRIEARHVMSRKVRTVDPGTPVSDLKALMEMEGFHHLLVMRDDKLLGIISDRDVANRRGRTAANIMTPRPQTIAPTTQLSQVITLALQRRISCVPVTEDGFVKGILTTTDMLMTLQCLMQLLERQHSESNSGSNIVMTTAIHAPPVTAASPVTC